MNLKPHYSQDKEFELTIGTSLQPFGDIPDYFLFGKMSKAVEFLERGENGWWISVDDPETGETVAILVRGSLGVRDLFWITTFDAGDDVMDYYEIGRDVYDTKVLKGFKREVMKYGRNIDDTYYFYCPYCDSSFPVVDDKAYITTCKACGESIMVRPEEFVI